ncbi:ankyrin repeat domain-containing protein [Myxococcus sp. AB056]|uniref:ankyrin repeat domain-containing protein n=1 Tax=Myxococcus sp. AB056 TaxID=2562792 RepID=UPI001E47C6A7|nr:ankyrin repeat domain-containing protein [Myxococcus sp. AB056]
MPLANIWRVMLMTLFTMACAASAGAGNGGSPEALFQAAEKGDAAAVSELLRQGAVVDARDSAGNTSLLLATNRLGWTGLLEAILLSDGGPRHQAIVRLLIDGGADVNLADGNGVTPLQHARERKQDAIAKMLVAAGGR